MSSLRICNALSSTVLRSAVAPSVVGSTGSRSISHACMRVARPSTSTLRPSLTAHAKPPVSTLLQHRLASSSAPHFRQGQPASSSSSQSNGSGTIVASEHLNATLDKEFRLRRSHGMLFPGEPTTGRSIAVQSGDVGRAYRTVMSILRKDDIRGELRRGERYEKPNQERRRKRSERHRRRFADLVRKKVQLVMALRARDV
ncbi:hypothetical protein CF326_g95 [Tilletia indica]|nr:hypothetical protein CF326_g95 [Tilletia indica]